MAGEHFVTIYDAGMRIEVPNMGYFVEYDQRANTVKFLCPKSKVYCAYTKAEFLAGYRSFVQRMTWFSELRTPLRSYPELKDGLPAHTEVFKIENSDDTYWQSDVGARKSASTQATAYFTTARFCPMKEAGPLLCVLYGLPRREEPPYLLVLSVAGKETVALKTLALKRTDDLPWKSYCPGKDWKKVSMPEFVHRLPVGNVLGDVFNP